MTWISIGAFARPSEPTDKEYSIRCAEHQGSASATAGDDPKRACYYEEGSPEERAWARAYQGKRRELAGRKGV